MKAKAWKRALSMVLALMMAFSLAVYPAYATNASGELLSEATALEPTAADDVDTVASESNSNAGIAMIDLDEDDETSVTLPEAVNGVITLTQDYALTESYVLNSGDVTIDLNGYSITRGEGNTTSYLIGVVSGAILTVKDSSEGETGSIDSSNYTKDETTYAGIGILTNGTVNIVSGTVAGYYGVRVSGSAAGLNVTGGTVNGTYAGAYAYNGGTVSISSGTVSGYYCGAYVTGTTSTLTVSENAVVKSTVTIDMNNLTTGQTSTCGISVNDGATATINGGTVAGGYVGISVWEGNSAENPSTLIVNGGTISGAAFGVSTNGSKHYTDITVNGGTISGITGMYLPAMDSTTTINGGTITGTSTGIEIRAGSLTVDGGTITSTAESGTFSESGNESGTTTVGAAIAVVQHTTKQDVTVTITDGSISGYYGIFEADLQGNGTDYTQYVTISVSGGTISTTDSTNSTAIYHGTTSAASIPLTGGTYNTDPSAYVAKGYEAVDNGNGTWTVQEATTTATIQIYNSMTLSSNLAFNFLIKKSDLADATGYTLTITKTTVIDGVSTDESTTLALTDGADYLDYYADYWLVKYDEFYTYEYESTLIAVLKDGSGNVVGTEQSYTSVYDYLTYTTENSASENNRIITAAALTYCEATKTYYENQENKTVG